MSKIVTVPADPPEYRYENALKWIRLITGLHYFGGAFEPEHMRSLANLAADALSGDRDLPDFEEAQAKTQERARKMADRLQAVMDEGRDDDA